jgi:hypothetical protein
MRPDLGALAHGVSRLARLPFVIESTAREQERLRRERAVFVEAYALDSAPQEDEKTWAIPSTGEAPEQHTLQNA